MMNQQIKYIQILNSTRQEKLYMAKFFDSQRNLVKTTHFGSKHGRSYIIHRDDDIKDAWIARHEVRGTFDKPTSPSALARWLLWSKPSLSASFKDYLKRFKLKEY